MDQCPQDHSAIGRQRGVTSLFVTLIVILVVMLLGVTAAMLSGTQFQLAGNLQSENTAFNQAESAVAAAKVFLATGSANAGFTTYDGTNSPYLYPIGSTANGISDPSTMTWSDSTSLAVNSNSRYFIQKVGQNVRLPGDVEDGGPPKKCERADLFRISAQGTGPKGTTRLIQTTFIFPSARPQC